MRERHVEELLCSARCTTAAQESDDTGEPCMPRAGACRAVVGHYSWASASPRRGQFLKRYIRYNGGRSASQDNREYK